MTIKTNHHEDLIRKVRAAGESLIKNAESIVGTEKYIADLRITVDIDATDEVPTIDISRSFIPERCVEG